MGQSRSRTNRLTVAATAVVVVAAGLATAGQASAAPKERSGAFKTPEHSSRATTREPTTKPRALQAITGTRTFLLTLNTPSTQQAFERNRPNGKAAARSAARAQLPRVNASQSRVSRSLPHGAKVLYKTHTALNSIAVRTSAKNSAKLQRIAGVTAVYPIASKRPSNAYAVPLVGADSVWQSLGNTGQNTTIAIVDTGLDYTHSGFGGPGTPGDYETARAGEADPADPGLFPSSKIIGGYDFAGDAYDGSNAPQPDPNPLDCNGHGTHVGGTAAGFGVNPDGSTYDGPYDESTPFGTLKIGPGVAPDAKLYGFRVFGCDGFSDVVGAALERAADPNQDGDPSDHVDVVNMSLGSDFGSSLDGDSVLSNALVELGINVVVASGNGGDLYDVGGSPGNAVRTIAVANSTDAAAQLDALTVSGPVLIAGDYGAQRSVAYDWVNDPDLAGDVAQVTQAENLDGCDALNGSDAAAVSGKIAWVEWTDDDTTRRCGSVARSTNLANAGAIGFIFADDREAFSAGITGSTSIPGVMVTKSAGDTIRPLIGVGVTIGGTTANGFSQQIAGNDDLVNDSSSRNSRGAGGVKPDVAAVGTSIFSTANGTGSAGESLTGTSMATPMVAGLTSLVVSEHPDWTTEEVKADVMNTAGQDVYTGPNHTGDLFAPNRVGSGRIDAAAALENDVLAYVADDHGAVSASFGPVEVTEPTVLTKTITVSNKGLTAASYDVSYEAITEIPGAEYSVEPASITVDGRSSKTVELTLTIDPALLTKTIDPTMQRSQGGEPREYLADASGRVVLDSADRPDLRVPVYSAPRPASQMTQASSLTLPGGEVQTADLELTGTDVFQGSGDELIASLMAGFELQAVSGLAPDCADAAAVGCVHNADERASDLKYVGTTSAFFDTDPIADGWGYFAISTHGPWYTAASQNEFDVLIDTDQDGAADFIVANLRFNDTDIQVSALFSATGDFLDYWYLNDVAGDVDTALFDSDTMLLTFPIAALGIDENNSRISYAVEAYSNQADAPVDVVGVDADGNIDGSLSYDLLTPGVYLGDGDRVLFDDFATTIPLTRNRDAYNADNGLGALIVHLHNGVGQKAQVVALGTEVPSNVTLSLARSRVQAGKRVTASVSVDNTENTVPTGTIRLETSAGKLLGSASLDVDGNATISFRPSAAGSYSMRAKYSGDATYSAGTSPSRSLTVTKIRSTVKLRVPKVVKQGQRFTARVVVPTVNGLVPKGKVLIKRGGKTLGSAKLVNGRATVRLKIAQRGKVRIFAKYKGNRSYTAGTSITKTVKVV